MAREQHPNRQIMEFTLGTGATFPSPSTVTTGARSGNWGNIPGAGPQHTALVGLDYQFASLTIPSAPANTALSVATNPTTFNIASVKSNPQDLALYFWVWYTLDWFQPSVSLSWSSLALAATSPSGSIYTTRSIPVGTQINSWAATLTLGFYNGPGAVGSTALNVHLFAQVWVKPG